MKSIPKGLKALNILTGVLFAVALFLVLFYAPSEKDMGEVQRVFYFHVSAGWVGALAFLVAAISGVIYLIRSDRRWDRVALASVEIGVIFTFINIVTGSIWARPIWNSWWTWDPRLVTATIMELIYIAYLMLRQGLDDPDRRARFGAVYSIVGFISVPLTFLSIRIFRTIHPVVIGSGDPTAADINMTSRMQTAFFFSLFTFTFVYFTLLWHQIRLQRLEEKVQQRKMDLLTS